MINKLKPFLWIIVVLIFVACSTNSMVVPTSRSTSTATANIPVRPTSSLPAKLVRVPQPTEMTATSLPPSPTARYDLQVDEVENGDTGDYVETAFWSDEGKLVYAFRLDNTNKKILAWNVYDPGTHSSITISSPLKYDRRVWQRLGVPEPYKDTDVYPELSGYVSPSGKYVIYSVDHGDISLGSTDPSAKREFWLSSSDGRQKRKLLEGFLLGGISDIAWLNDETKVIFDYGYEGGVRLYIVDIPKRTVTPLSEMSEFKGGTEQRWAVSPDGKTLAIIDFDLNLYLLDLGTGKTMAIDRKARHPWWSKDGRALYYWWGPEFEDVTLRSYDMVSGNISCVVDLVDFANRLIPYDRYAISPDGSRIAFWKPGLWIVDIFK